MRHFNDMRPNKNETKQYITTKYKTRMAPIWPCLNPPLPAGVD